MAGFFPPWQDLQSLSRLSFLVLSDFFSRRWKYMLGPEYHLNFRAGGTFLVFLYGKSYLSFNPVRQLPVSYRLHQSQPKENRMPDLTLWKNQQLYRMKKDIDKMFYELFRYFGATGLDEGEHLHLPELVETADELIITFEIPGMNDNQLEIWADEDGLRLQGQTMEKHIAKDGGTLSSRRAFSSKLRLPCRIMPEKATATIQGDTLTITMPKCIPGGLRKIPIRHK
jgi:HSP20 family protein